jgi:hypothetical protein
MPRSASKNATGFAVILLRRSACKRELLRSNGPLDCRRRDQPFGEFGALSRGATSQPTTKRLKRSRMT